MSFTKKEIKNWEKFEAVRKSGRFNMFDPQARRASGLEQKDYSFTMKNFSKLKAQAEQEAQ